MTVPRALFSLRSFVIMVAVFLGGVFLLNRIARWVYYGLGVDFDLAYYFPVSIFEPITPDAGRIAAAIGCLALFAAITFALRRARWPLAAVIGAGCVLAIACNGIQGWERGFVQPTAGVSGDANEQSAIQYYHDALEVTDPASFLRTFNERQLTLRDHSITHPPGAGPLYWAADRLCGNVGVISLLIGCIGLVLTGWGAARTLGALLDDRDTVHVLTYVTMLLPAVQIYGISSLDVLFTGLLIASMQCLLFVRTSTGLAAGVAFFIAASFLSCGVLFLIPVVVIVELVRQRSILRAAVLLGASGAFYLALFLVSGYDYLSAFLVASRSENPDGFRLFAAPADYAMTRLEGVAEIALFLGPFVVWLLIRDAVRTGRKEGLITLVAATSVGTLLAMFLSGAFRTGETARLCAYLYPVLLAMVGRELSRRGDAERLAIQLAALVFLQTVVMQVVGDYFW